MCACTVACADVPEVRKNAKDWVVVSGAMVDRYSVDESKIPDMVISKCNQLLAADSAGPDSKPNAAIESNIQPNI